MKLIVAGSTGFVATEIIRQALARPEIKSVVALARRPTPVPDNVPAGSDVSKLKSVACDNFEEYSEGVKQALSGADACIWTIAVTPSKVGKMQWEQVRRICHDYSMAGLKTISQLPHGGSSTPFRFLYVSGSNAERDPAKKPWVMGDYCLLRGETESQILAYAHQSKGTVDAAVAKPGLIDAPGKWGVMMKAASNVGRYLIGLPEVQVSEIAATLLDQAVNGIEKDTLLNEDLVRIGRKTLETQKQGS
ncbi:hypothetical protein HIM_05424 [Hirsutella minnesotensis 3608]|uniref:Uncharacterized protein n=1 Tax=Hirsutella minnesotensis 3608 TaxID=1043627 RepID=A0A0F7ZPB9_9HYPO|nr:hypothetical protein HIM_05424 [Hirsutella minnesotensis 3608]